MSYAKGIVNKILEGADVRSAIVDALAYRKSVRGSLKESDSYDQDDDPYAQKRGTYVVYSVANDFMELTGDKRFNDPGKALEYWFKQSRKYPTCTAITGYVPDEARLREWVVANEDKVREWHEKYHCPYKLGYLLDACRKSVGSRSDKYPDQMYPFCLG